MFTSLKKTPNNYEKSKRDATYTHPVVVHSADAAALPVVHCKCGRGWQPNFFATQTVFGSQAACSS
jgi:hypothetical protein